MSSRTLALISGAGAVGVGPAVKVAVPSGKPEVPIVIRGITTATVAIEGSLDGTNWFALTSKTANFAGTVIVFPYMRANVTAWTSGSITAEIFADKAFGA